MWPTGPKIDHSAGITFTPNSLEGFPKPGRGLCLADERLGSCCLSHAAGPLNSVSLGGGGGQVDQGVVMNIRSRMDVLRATLLASAALRQQPQRNLPLFVVEMDTQNRAIQTQAGRDNESNVLIPGHARRDRMGERTLRRDRFQTFRADFHHDGLKWSHEIRHRATDHAEA